MKDKSKLFLNLICDNAKPVPVVTEEKPKAEKKSKKKKEN